MGILIPQMHKYLEWSDNPSVYASNVGVLQRGFFHSPLERGVDERPENNCHHIPPPFFFYCSSVWC